MIPVERIEPPDGFEENVRAKGLAWIAGQRQPINKFQPYWTWCEPYLHDAFRGRCGWAAMWITSGWVEHFVSQTECVRRAQPELAYDWYNYRYVMPELNSSKKRWRPVLDPFDVKPGWFRIHLPTFHLVMTDAIPPEYRPLATETLVGLGLDKSVKLLRIRRKWMARYLEGKIQITALDDDFPQLSEAIRALLEAPDADLSEPQREYRAEIIARRQAAGVSVP
ncbi:MAG: hypothetical protein HC927_06395 [Deltaproteobacteria bacterium]|nr:hypothetical protein [Deltaproteobacteria bacterium]